MRPDARDLSSGRVLRDRYVLEAELGRGGMGVVYRARDLALDREVAVKVMRDAGNVSLRVRFLREAQLASRVQHPHTVCIIDFGELPDGDCFLTMELLHGRTLARALADCGTMSPLRACRIAAMIASGLQSVHGKGIVHRDLKPANVFLLDMEGTSDFVKIVDFGVAKELAADPSLDGTVGGGATLEPEGNAVQAHEGALTRPGALVGTPRYMAPEQLSGKPVDARVDQYALGCILYELLTGAPPFPGDAQQAARGHLYGELISPRQSAPQAGISSELDALIQRAMARRPENRFADMGELGHALLAESERLSHPLRPRRRLAVVTIPLALVTAMLAAMGLRSLGRREALQPRVSAPRRELPEPAAWLPESAAPLPEGRAIRAPPAASARPSSITGSRVESTPPLPVVPAPAESQRSQTPPRAALRAPRPGSEAESAVTALIQQAVAALERKELIEAQRLLEAARARCAADSRSQSAEREGCGLAKLTVALHFGRVHEAAGEWSEALAEYQRVLDGASTTTDPAQQLSFRAQAESARARLLPRVGRVILTRMRGDRCQEVSMLLPPGEHQIEINGENQTIALRARETLRLGSCTPP